MSVGVDWDVFHHQQMARQKSIEHVLAGLMGKVLDLVSRMGQLVRDDSPLISEHRQIQLVEFETQLAKFRDEVGQLAAVGDVPATVGVAPVPDTEQRGDLSVSDGYQHSHTFACPRHAPIPPDILQAVRSLGDAGATEVAALDGNAKVREMVDWRVRGLTRTRMAVELLRPSGWEYRFMVKRSNISGRGLFARRAYRRGEYLTVFRGEDLGAEGSSEGLSNRQRLFQSRSADHIAVVKGRYLDCLNSPTCAQFMNAGLGQTHNARFTRNGSVLATRRIRVGDEILLGYGSKYWREKRRDERRMKCLARGL